MKNTVQLILLIALSGAFGGFVYGLFTRTSYKLRLPFTGKLIEIGFFGDLLVGIAASIAVFFMAGSIFNLKFETILTSDDWIKIMALGVLSGFTGIRLLSGMSSKLLQKVTEIDKRLDQVEKVDRILELLPQADFYLDTNPDRALLIYDKALRIDDKNVPTLIGKAKALRRKDRLSEAIIILNQIIECDPNADRAYYNRACYKNISMDYSKDEILVDLRKAISLDPSYRDYAKSDDDFKDLWEDPDFKITLTTL